MGAGVGSGVAGSADGSADGSAAPGADGSADGDGGRPGRATAVAGREDLLARYRELVLDVLPRRGRAEGWAVQVDHCVGRVVLDNTLGGAWRTVLPAGRGAAYTRLAPEDLARAVALAERMDAEGADLVAELDARSLAWRGKPAKRPPR